jgi:hypothetical protein
MNRLLDDNNNDAAVVRAGGGSGGQNQEARALGSTRNHAMIKHRSAAAAAAALSAGQEVLAGPMILELPTAMTTTRPATQIAAPFPRNHPRRSRRDMFSIFLSSPFVLLVTAYTYFHLSLFFSTHHREHPPKKVVPPPMPTPATCTAFQLDTIRRQLPVADCHDYQARPWYNKCSFSYATRCPDASFWLGPEYNHNHNDPNKTTARIKDDRTTNSLTAAATGPGGSGSRGGGENGRRIAIYVGCNKALDAVNTLRMLSGDPRFDKTVWRNALFGMDHGPRLDNSNKGTSVPLAAPLKFEGGRCGQDNDDQFELAPNSAMMNAVPTTVHCIEAMPVTARHLQQTAQKLRYNDQLIVANVAMGNVADDDPSTTTKRTVWFPNRNDDTIGVENLGISNCPQDGPPPPGKSNNNNPIDCIQVPLYGLDGYLRRYDTVLNHLLPSSPQAESFTTAALPPPQDAATFAEVIDFLSIDVEGYDYEVLLGAPLTLKRTKYLEFEYNWKGPWAAHQLSQVIDRLQTDHGLWCYWAGAHGNLWRITDCWLSHYGTKFWSNVACVNARLSEAAPLAQRMEERFANTLAAADSIRYDAEATSRTSGRVVVEPTE